MADGPFDYGSGYFFESQKGISDRRAAAGFPPGPDSAGRGNHSANRGGAANGGGSLIATMLLGALLLMWKVAEFALPILLMLMWEVVKLVGRIFVAILSGGKRR